VADTKKTSKITKQHLILRLYKEHLECLHRFSYDLAILLLRLWMLSRWYSSQCKIYIQQTWGNPEFFEFSMRRLSNHDWEDLLQHHAFMDSKYPHVYGRIGKKFGLTYCRYIDMRLVRSDTLAHSPEFLFLGSRLGIWISERGSLTLRAQACLGFWLYRARETAMERQYLVIVVCLFLAQGWNSEADFGRLQLAFILYIIVSCFRKALFDGLDIPILVYRLFFINHRSGSYFNHISLLNNDSC